MRLRRRAAIAGILTWLTFAVSAGAEAPAPSVVWYRASEECPAGPEFLGKLASASSRARLADAGDHIDFVVTLVAAHGQTVGRLERQTQGGTVAIRELRDVSCARVADALALSLGLALEPEQPAAVPTAATVETDPPPSPPPPPLPAVSPPVAPQISAPGAPRAADVRHSSAATSSAPRWSTGLEGGAIFGVAPSALARAAAFVEVDRAFSGFASELSLRLALVGALGSPATAVGPVQQWIVAGRAEACPWRWGGARVSLRPCIDFELGATGASDARATGEHASSLWAAPGIGLRGGALLLPKLTLEVGADALLPLVRSEIDAGSTRLYRGEFAALIAYLGVSVGPF